MRRASPGLGQRRDRDVRHRRERRSGAVPRLLRALGLLTSCCCKCSRFWCLPAPSPPNIWASVFERMYANLVSARAEAQRGQELWTTLIEQLPVPAVLVDADTSQIICASQHFAPGFCELDAEIVGNDLFKAIHFSYPEVVQDLVTGFGGAAPLSMVHVGDQIRVTDVRVQHVAQRGRRFALLLLMDTTDAFIRKAALEAADHAALVVDANGRILAFNRQATSLFPNAEAGS